MRYQKTTTIVPSFIICIPQLLLFLLFLIGCTTQLDESDIRNDSSAAKRSSSSRKALHSSADSSENLSSSSQAYSSSTITISSSSTVISSAIELPMSSYIDENSSEALSSEDLLSSSSESLSSSAIPAPQWKIEGSIYSLTSGEYLLEIDAHNGGRIITYALNGKNTLLNSDPDKGSTFWLSPQSDWPNSWPPSNEIDNGPYAVSLSDDQTLLTLTSPVDHLTGMTVEKQYSYNPQTDGAEITYSIINTSNKQQHVAPWANSRCYTGGITFFPKGDDTQILSGIFDPLPLEPIGSINWLFHTTQHNLKTFQDGSEGWVAYYYDGLLFTQSFSDTPVHAFAPGESEIELFVNSAFIEVEYQGPYTLLEPDERLDWSLKWFLTSIDDISGVQEVGSTLLVNRARESL